MLLELLINIPIQTSGFVEIKLIQQFQKLPYSIEIPSIRDEYQPFLPSAPFLYPLPENIRKPQGFLMFSGVEKERNRKKWANLSLPVNSYQPGKRISRSEVLYKKALLKYFANLTGKHLCRSLFLTKLHASKVKLYQKLYSDIGRLLRLCGIGESN